MQLMNDEDQKWQQYKESLSQIEKQLKKQEEPNPDLYLQRSLGCFVGGLLGPIFCIAIIAVNEAFYPVEDSGSFNYLFAFVLSVPVSGISIAMLCPLLVKWMRKLFKRK